MHRFPERPALYVFFFQRFSNILSAWIPFGTIIYQNGAQPSVGEKIAVDFILKCNLRYVRKSLSIEIEILPSLLYPLCKHFHLTSSNPCAYIAHAVIVPNMGMLVVWCLVPGLCCQKPGFFDPVLIVGHQSAPSRSSDDFIAVERKYAHRPKST